MIADVGSLNLTVVGDWNKIFTDPVQISEALFEKNEKDVEFEMVRNTDKLVLFCKHQSVTIAPSQERMVISCDDFKDETIAYFASISKAFFQKIPSPLVVAYGYNLSFHEDQDEHFAELIDCTLSQTKLSEHRAIIVGNSLTLILEMENKRYDCRINSENNRTQILINNQYTVNAKSDTVILDSDFSISFVAQCNKLIEAFGYALEDPKA